MAGTKTRRRGVGKKAPVSQPQKPVEGSSPPEPIQTPVEEKGAQEDLQDAAVGKNPFETVYWFSPADKSYCRKIEACEYGYSGNVLVRSSFTARNSEGNVTACSESMAVIKGTVAGLKAGRW